MLRIVTIIGARPQFVKAAVVSRYIKESCQGAVEETIVHTGQHYDSNMSEVFFSQLDIPKPDYFLDINGLSHGAMTGQMLEKIEKILIDLNPDWVLVYGDTNSTLAGALAARKLNIKVAHVEAGLRSNNMIMPEETNRIITDRISDILFCPTDQSITNLKKEAFDLLPIKVVKCGDVMQDAAMFYSSKSQRPNFELPDKYILATIHRAENTDNRERLQSVFTALSEISKKISIVLPIHPRTKNLIEKNNIEFDSKNIRFCDPVGYLEMVYLLQNCELVMTDSGGLQKEAFFFKKLCLTLRDETEWVELVENKFNIVVGVSQSRILKGFENTSNNITDFSLPLYGDGNTGKVIVDTILNYETKI